MPLDRYLKEKSDPLLTVAVRNAREIAEGLAAAHKQGLVHRDLKPGYDVHRNVREWNEEMLTNTDTGFPSVSTGAAPGSTPPATAR